MKITHSGLVDRIAEDLDGAFTKTNIKRVLDAQSALITRELSQGNEVIIKDVVTLGPKLQGPRPVRNPQTGESWIMEAHHKPVARFASTLKAAVKGVKANP